MFDKYYVLDTNILLEDATNIYKLSQDGKNLIILAETVLDEIDTKKSGFDEINFQAREFAVGTHPIWPPRAFTFGQLTHNDLASVRIPKRATKSL